MFLFGCFSDRAPCPFAAFDKRPQVTDGLAAGDSGPEHFTIVTQPAGQCKSAAAPVGKKCGVPQAWGVSAAANATVSANVTASVDVNATTSTPANAVASRGKTAHGERCANYAKHLVKRRGGSLTDCSLFLHPLFAGRWYNKNAKRKGPQLSSLP